MEIIEEEINLNKAPISGTNPSCSCARIDYILRLILPEEPRLHQINEYGQRKTRYKAITDAILTLSTKRRNRQTPHEAPPQWCNPPPRVILPADLPSESVRHNRIFVRAGPLGVYGKNRSYQGTDDIGGVGGWLGV